ncbi:uncharacterized protein E0L32_005235 [Thyridium curvatum]|uniref:Uncharacterized protein n=1 Tax=Thyridium curvatum TaxID=1093900 RepID=A0A507B3X3_9PEZI|nr:uncharacterized protein E0L32_005235 [Thyridium curvatum]TPX14543.1 hypothetical protein E0L32_005235 [Thyridium curvatum]
MDKKAGMESPYQAILTTPSTHPLHKHIPPVRRYRKAAYISLAYIVLLVVPWALTCCLWYRPDAIIRPQRRHFYGTWTQQDYDDAWTRSAAATKIAAALINLTGVLGIPVVVALLARAAVVASMRRRPGQKLNARQLFSLADGHWFSRKRDKPVSWFLLGLALIVTPSLQGALLETGTREFPPPVDDDVSFDVDTGTTLVGYDPSPAVLDALSLAPVLATLRQKLINGGREELQRYVWFFGQSQPREPLQSQSGYTLREILTRINGNGEGADFGVSSVPWGVETGTSQYHALGMTSYATCAPIDRTAFPEPCPGPHPFTTQLDFPTAGGLRVCVPGDFSRALWENNLKKQDVEEELFVDVSYGPTSSLQRFTTRCTAKSSRGYIKVGSEGKPTIQAAFVDSLPDQERRRIYNPASKNKDPSSYVQPSYPDPFNSLPLNASGPLMMASIALFGNQSIIALARNQTAETFGDALVRACEDDMVPFSRLGAAFSDSAPAKACAGLAAARSGPSSPDSRLLSSMAFEAVNATVAPFAGDARRGASLLDLATLFANEAYLTTAASGQVGDGAVVSRSFATPARAVFRQPGVRLFVPRMSTVALAAISALVGLQVALIAVLLWYVYSVPTWTERLDALAVARLALQMPELSPLSRLGLSCVDKACRSRGLEPLESVDALVGVAVAAVGPDQEKGGYRSETAPTTSGAASTGAHTKEVTLAVGGEGNPFNTGLQASAPLISLPLSHSHPFHLGKRNITTTPFHSSLRTLPPNNPKELRPLLILQNLMRDDPDPQPLHPAHRLPRPEPGPVHPPFLLPQPLLVNGAPHLPGREVGQEVTPGAQPTGDPAQQGLLLGARQVDDAVEGEHGVEGGRREGQRHHVALEPGDPVARTPDVGPAEAHLLRREVVGRDARARQGRHQVPRDGHAGAAPELQERELPRLAVVTVTVTVTGEHEVEQLLQVGHAFRRVVDRPGVVLDGDGVVRLLEAGLEVLRRLGVVVAVGGGVRHVSDSCPRDDPAGSGGACAGWGLRKVWCELVSDQWGSFGSSLAVFADEAFDLPDKPGEGDGPACLYT